MKRYDIFAYCGCADNDINYEHNEHPTGDWCKWEDVQQLEAENASLKQDLEHELSLDNIRVELELENAKLREELKEALYQAVGDEKIINRYREALKKISVGTDRDNFPLMDSELRHIARAALEERW